MYCIPTQVDMGPAFLPLDKPLRALYNAVDLRNEGGHAGCSAASRDSVPRLKARKAGSIRTYHRPTGALGARYRAAMSGFGKAGARGVEPRTGFSARPCTLIREGRAFSVPPTSGMMRLSGATFAWTGHCGNGKAADARKARPEKAPKTKALRPGCGLTSKALEVFGRKPQH